MTRGTIACYVNIQHGSLVASVPLIFTPHFYPQRHVTQCHTTRIYQLQTRANSVVHTFEVLFVAMKSQHALYSILPSPRQICLERENNGKNPEQRLTCNTHQASSKENLSHNNHFTRHVTKKRANFILVTLGAFCSQSSERISTCYDLRP